MFLRGVCAHADVFLLGDCAVCTGSVPFGCTSLHCLTFCVCVIADRRLNITAEADCRKLHCALRDLSSLLQAVGRLAEFFTGDVFTSRFNDALAIVQRSVTL